MFIEEVPAPAETRPRPVFGALVSAVSISDQWIRVRLTDVAGKNSRNKRAAVVQAMKQAGIRVKTHIDADHIYLCRRDANEGVL